MTAGECQRMEQAFRDLDHLQPLFPDDPRLCESLFGDLLASVTQRLLLGRGQPQKLLLHGHIGSGKSTFLNLLEKGPDLCRGFMVVRVEIKDVVDPNDIDIIDLLLAMATAALHAASEQRILPQPESVPEFLGIVRELKGERRVDVETSLGREGQVSVEAGVSIPSLLAWLKGSFLANYKVSTATRKQVRDTFTPRIGDLINAVNDTFRAVESALGGDRRLLFLVHDTDKPEVQRALRLFDAQGFQLLQIQAAAVLVVDKALACSGRFSSFGVRAGATLPFPAFKVVERDGGKDTAKTRENRRLLADLVKRRLPEDLVEEAALQRILDLGGGICRETLYVAREATFSALRARRSTVQVDDVDAARIKRFNEFNLTQQQWTILRQVKDDPGWSPQSADEAVEGEGSPLLELLYQLALVEYTNGEEKWLRPHPALLPRLSSG
jgi:hypothetical protein